MKKDKKNIDENIKTVRIDWARNQAVIQQAYIELIRSLKRCPTVLEVSQKVNLSINAIDRHIKQMKFQPLQSPMRSLTPDVLASIYNSARKGQSASQKLWLQVMEGWSETQVLEFKNSITDLVRKANEAS